VLVVLGRVVYAAELPARPFSLAAALACGALAFAGLGVGLASLIRSAEGASAVVNVVILPMTFLSGGFGPTRSYPRVLRAVAEVLPLKHLIDAVTGIYLDREPVWEQGWALLVVLGWGVIGLVVAFRAFRWEPREG
jgi:ABC-2 type transport system permease protein